MKVTLGILARPEADLLEECLQSILKLHTLPDRVIIVGPASEKPSAQEVLKKIEGHFLAIGIDVSYSSVEGESQNAASFDHLVHSANTEILAVIDEYATVSHDWLSQALQALQGDQVAAVTGPAFAVSDSGESIGMPVREAVNQNTLGPLGEIRERSDLWLPPAPVETDFVRTHNVVFKRGFAEHLALNSDYASQSRVADIEWSLQLKGSDRSLIYHPDVALNRQEPRPEQNSKAAAHREGLDYIAFLQKNFGDVFKQAIKRVNRSFEPTLPPTIPRALMASTFGNKPEMRELVKGLKAGIKKAHGANGKTASDKKSKSKAQEAVSPSEPSAPAATPVTAEPPSEVVAKEQPAAEESAGVDSKTS